jgi:hypothetical protein
MPLTKTRNRSSLGATGPFLLAPFPAKRLEWLEDLYIVRQLLGRNGGCGACWPQDMGFDTPQMVFGSFPHADMPAFL